MRYIFMIFALLLINLQAKEYVVKFSQVTAASTPKGKAAEYFAKRVNELSGGRIKVQVYHSAQLYNDDKVFVALKLNNVQIAVPSLAKFSPIVPEFALFDLPFLFRDLSHVRAATDGEAGKQLKAMIAKKGFVPFRYWDAGLKDFSSNDVPIITPKDAVGHKFRIQSSKVLEAQIKAMGASPQILPFSEVYSALSQGVVDATENPLSNFYNSKFYEVQNRLSLTQHGYLGSLVIVSAKFWRGLPDELKRAFTQAMDEATEYERAQTDVDNERMLNELKEYAASSKKLEIYELNEQQRKQWQEAMAVVYEQFEPVIGKELIELARQAK
ncbi:DctP family TRAP transporter solute-binding subunit [Campylobacter sp. 19-13652]|uniref:DctP family TRAP transporter solute-binding subunit n=1 Tax=Campylobacter sp. 19-13652 TaxID=2840180 RepID=UPI001C777645|nr:DctP family TRAP transporter solute-binding subunit [Campylobacter sp. 19-13652]BCX80258.1 C4-dicarboxylate ABC transporter [Campylobacter sp. 19-13652]